MSPIFEQRRERMRAEMHARGFSGLLVSSPANVRYLSGFTGDSSYLLFAGERQIFISDTRFETQIGHECPGFELEIRDASRTTDQLASEVAGRLGLSSIAAEFDTLTKAAYDRIASHGSGVAIIDSEGLVAGLRAIKDETEVATIRRSIRVAERAVQVILAQFEHTQSELQIAHQLEHEIRKLGGSGCSFPPIVGVGPNSALPHGHPSATRLESSNFVLIDWGAMVHGYASDLTRVFVTGKIPAKIEKIWGVVLAAQRAALELIRPGVALRTVDAAARAVIAEAGFADYFGHGLGHGFGLEIHELPRLSPAADGTLAAGMVVTVEPGIYLPELGGVRLEDDVLVTAEGCEVLSSLPKELDQVYISCF